MGVAQKLLHKLRVHSHAEQQRCARVAQVVEADGVGETGFDENATLRQ